MRASIQTTPPSRCRAARFAAMPVLAAGLMLSCGEKPPERASIPAPAEPAPYRPVQRADNSYSIGYTVGCPIWMVRVNDEPKDYCSDRFEAYAVVVKNGAEEAHPSSMDPKNERIIARVAPGVRPQSSVNREQAERACWNAGKRLCSIREWTRACRGVNDYNYPYGPREQPKICNTRKPHLLTELHGSNAKAWGRNMNDPFLNMVKGYLANAGEYAGCVSSYGTYDMVGNLHEWVSESVTDEFLSHRGRPKPGARTNPGFKAVPGNGIFFGGFYGTGTENGEGCDYATVVHGPTQRDYSIGFRCCKEADK